MTELRRTELDALLMTVAEAADLAYTAEIEAGHRALQSGPARAEELAEEPDAPAWTWDLVWRYREALARYDETYGAGRRRN
jgi:hypothetical protein